MYFPLLSFSLHTCASTHTHTKHSLSAVACVCGISPMILCCSESQCVLTQVPHSGGTRAPMTIGILNAQRTRPGASRVSPTQGSGVNAIAQRAHQVGGSSSSIVQLQSSESSSSSSSAASNAAIQSWCAVVLKMMRVRMKY